MDLATMIGLIAGILSIYQFATRGKELTMKLRGSKKLDSWNGLKVF